MATVVDIAKLANVSVATVSRVIRDSNRVSDEKRQRVLDAIKELNYKVNTESSVTRMRKKTILLICGSCQDEFIDSIYESASEYDYELAIYYTAGHALTISAFMKKLIKDKVICGVITFGLTADSAMALEEINESIPVVQCCDEIIITNSFVVSSDDFAMGKDAVTCLLDAGYQRIGFVGLGNMSMPYKYSSECENGYAAALNKRQVPFDEKLVYQCDLTKESVDEAVNYFLNMEDRPDAVFCVRDHTAIQFVNELTRKGIKIPGEMAVFGRGSNESAEQCWLPLSNVTHSYYEIGREAINIIYNRIIEKLTLGRKTNIQHQIIERSTT